jgi:hypothetical protein
MATLTGKLQAHSVPYGINKNPAADGGNDIGGKDKVRQDYLDES